ncbi:MAG: hypothetical protein RIC35_04580 [Marinoscillum sp.]
MEKTLSTRWFKTYKILFATLILLIVGVNIWNFTRIMENKWAGMLAFVGLIIYWGIYVNRHIRLFLKSFRQIKYSNDTLYVDQGGTELVVPFHEIKRVELTSLDGIYSFELIDGIRYCCKPSMWYPFNHKKVDAELDRIRQNIKKEKQKYWSSDSAVNTLSSQNFS